MPLSNEKLVCMKLKGTTVPGWDKVDGGNIGETPQLGAADCQFSCWLHSTSNLHYKISMVDSAIESSEERNLETISRSQQTPQMPFHFPLGDTEPSINVNNTRTQLTLQK